MPTPRPRPPTDILKSIESNATAVRVAAATLTKRVEAFQDYLSKLPGRVETICFTDAPDVDPEDPRSVALALKLHREGKDWIISWAMSWEDSTHDFRPLVGAPLKIKLAALKAAPDFLAQIESAQRDIVDELEAATTEFDAFLNDLNSSASSPVAQGEATTPPKLPRRVQTPKAGGTLIKRIRVIDKGVSGDVVIKDDADGGIVFEEDK